MRVLYIIVASYLFSKVVAILHSATDTTMFLRILQSIYIDSFSIGTTISISLMELLKKKNPPTLLLASSSTK